MAEHDILMTESDTVFIQGAYRDFEEGETYTVPAWVYRSLLEKGTATDAPEEESFAPTEERETKTVASEDALLSGVKVPAQEVTAEPTSDGSNWYQFRTSDGDLVEKDDGDVYKVLGTEKRDDVLDAMN